MRIGVIAFLVLFSFNSCQDNASEEGTLSGKATLAADESFIRLADAQIKIFEYIYKQADISSAAVPESETVPQFTEGKADMVIIGRELSEKEKGSLEEKGIRPQTYKIASDGIALIVHRDRKDSLLSARQLKNILNGNIRNWTELGSPEEGGIVLAFDRNNSSNILFVNRQYPLSVEKANVFAAGSDEKVIDYVKTHKEAIGLISIAHFSDDPATNEHLKNLHVLSLDGYYPWQEDLATGKYPLKRDIFLHTRFKSGLGTGFASFVLSEDGQRIILKAGLLPAKMPGREVIFN